MTAGRRRMVISIGAVAGVNHVEATWCFAFRWQTRWLGIKKSSSLSGCQRLDSNQYLPSSFQGRAGLLSMVYLFLGFRFRIRLRLGLRSFVWLNVIWASLLPTSFFCFCTHFASAPLVTNSKHLDQTVNLTLALIITNFGLGGWGLLRASFCTTFRE